METSLVDAAKPRTFAEEVQGTDTHALDLTLGQLAADVYAKEGTTLNGWRPVTPAELANVGVDENLFENETTGFGARLYTDGHGDYVLAFRGTNEGRDWCHNVKQGLGLDDAQYDQALKLASQISHSFGKDNLAITGHSLGGGLASAASLKTGSPAVTFNSSGLHDNTIEALHLDPRAAREWANAGHIRRYAVDHEILTTLQERNVLTRGLLPDAIGHKIELNDPHPLHGWKKLIPGSSVRHGIDMHGMDSVREAQLLALQGLITNPTHPANGMFNQAIGGLKAIKPDMLGFRSEAEYRNAAGSLTVKAREAGMQRIDHVVIGTNGSIFAVEGPLENASHRIAGMDKAQAAEQPIETSSRQLGPQHRPEAQIGSPQAEVTRRAVFVP
jgi:hypothetical protein